MHAPLAKKNTRAREKITMTRLVSAKRIMRQGVREGLGFLSMCLQNAGNGKSVSKIRHSRRCSSPR